MKTVKEKHKNHNRCYVNYICIYSTNRVSEGIMESNPMLSPIPLAEGSKPTVCLITFLRFGHFKQSLLISFSFNAWEEGQNSSISYGQQGDGIRLEAKSISCFCHSLQPWFAKSSNSYLSLGNQREKLTST